MIKLMSGQNLQIEGGSVLSCFLGLSENLPQQERYFT